MRRRGRTALHQKKKKHNGSRKREWKEKVSPAGPSREQRPHLEGTSNVREYLEDKKATRKKGSLSPKPHPFRRNRTR